MTVEAIRLDARSALVMVLNRLYTGNGAKVDEAVPLDFANAVLEELGYVPVVQTVEVRAAVPIMQSWNGDIEIDSYDITDNIKEAVWNECGEEGIDEDDLEIDTGYVGSVTANVSAEVTATFTTDLEIELEYESSLEDAVADNIDLHGNWEIDGNGSILIERQFRRFS